MRISIREPIGGRPPRQIHCSFCYYEVPPIFLQTIHAHIYITRKGAQWEASDSTLSSNVLHVVNYAGRPPHTASKAEPSAPHCDSLAHTH